MSASSAISSGFVDLRAASRDLRLEYARVGSEQPDAPLLAFLHEGLGSVAMWKDFPAQLCAAVGARGLVYSRPGYDGSIALIHAASFPQRVAGTIVMAPHIAVEAWHRSTVSSRPRRGRSCSSFPTAAIRRTATRPRP